MVKGCGDCYATGLPDDAKVCPVCGAEFRSIFPEKDATLPSEEGLGMREPV